MIPEQCVFSITLPILMYLWKSISDVMSYAYLLAAQGINPFSVL